MYIIQTNTLVDDKGIERDFQSRVYQIKEQTWDEFRDYILSNEGFVMKLVNGTMAGAIKPRQSRVTSVLINDERHLRVTFNSSYDAKFYMVTDEEFANLT